MSRSPSKRSLTRGAGLWFSAVIAAAVPFASAAAQRPAELVDRIVAVVGDTIILQTEIEEAILDFQIRGGRVPPADSPEFRELMRQVLEQKVNELLLLIHAAREGIIVGDDEVQELVEQQIASIRRRYQSRADFEQALANRGQTPAEYRLMLTEQARAQLMEQRYLQQRMSMLQPIPVSEEELRDAFEEQKTLLGPKPATVTLKQVILTTRPSEDSLLAALTLAEEALSRARSGEDFARLAREYSDDDASRSEGGNLGWVQRGELLPEFDDALFSLRPGDISDVIEAAVGFFIIKLERVKGNDRLARHILIMPGITEADIELTRALADSVASAMRAGADPDSLIRRYGDPAERASLTNFPQDQLPEFYRLALRGARPGDVVGPIELSTPSIASKWAVVKVLDTSSGGEWKLDDVRDQLRAQIQQQRMIEKVVDELRGKTYIELRLDDYPVSG